MIANHGNASNSRSCEFSLASSLFKNAVQYDPVTIKSASPTVQ